MSVDITQTTTLEWIQVKLTETTGVTHEAQKQPLFPRNPPSEHHEGLLLFMRLIGTQRQINTHASKLAHMLHTHTHINLDTHTQKKKRHGSLLTAAYLNKLSVRSKRREERRGGGRIDKRPLRFCAAGVQGWSVWGPIRLWMNDVCQVAERCSENSY